jgi:cell division septation protein DedD
MHSQRGYSFPTAFLTFSLLLLVMAAGFAVGRLVIGRAYPRGAGQFERLSTARPETAGRPTVETEPPPGAVHVPEEKEHRPEQRAEPRPSPAQGEEPEPPAAEVPEVAPTPEEPAEETSVPTEAPGTEARGKRYAIQVGMFASEQGAQQVADELTRDGYPARVEVTRGEAGGTVFRVLTGRYRTEYAARKAMEQLRQEGYPGFLVER